MQDDHNDFDYGVALPLAWIAGGVVAIAGVLAFAYLLLVA